MVQCYHELHFVLNSTVSMLQKGDKSVCQSSIFTQWLNPLINQSYLYAISQVHL